MTKKHFVISLILLHLILQLTLTFISSIHWFLLVISLISYVIVLVKEYYQKNRSSLLCNHYISSIIFTIIHFIVILAYNKILPWEIGLVVLFLILILHYSRRLAPSLFRFDLQWMPIGYPTDADGFLSSIVVKKFLISSLLFFAYTCQLGLTTVCTPTIIFNWFLIVNDCRYTYSNLFSSYTFSGVILVSLSWTLMIFFHLLPHRFRL